MARAIARAANCRRTGVREARVINLPSSNMERLPHAPGQRRVPAKVKIHAAMAGSDYFIWLTATDRRGQSL
ncbi:hypothetical protein GCM10011408_29580 [Dyella caseinilytica]|nr:hypothetical protein GCM10011408_29580 [Dyella caseinilytica]